MHAIKDRVSEKLSRLFSDSPSSQTLDQESEARPYAKDGKSLASILAVFIPSVSFDWFRHNGQNNEVKSFESDSFKWRSKSFSRKDKPLDYVEGDDEHETRENVDSLEEKGECYTVGNLHQNHKLSSNHLENGEPDSARSIGGNSDVFEDALTPHGYEKPLLNLLDESLFITPELYHFFDSSLPNIVKGCQWVLMYSTARDGISLRTLIRNSAVASGPCLLIASDKKGAVFGGLLECPLKPTAKRKYQGTNQTFVFTTIYGEPRLFRPTGANRYFYLCLNDLLALGGGANFALCFNEDLLTGSSGPCETFGNLCLAHDHEFDLRNVELWGFTHASQYVH